MLFVCLFIYFSAEDMVSFTRRMFSALKPRLPPSSSTSRSEAQPLRPPPPPPIRSRSPSPPPPPIVTPLLEMGFQLPHIQRALSATGMIIFDSLVLDWMISILAGALLPSGCSVSSVGGVCICQPVLTGVALYIFGASELNGWANRCMSISCVFIVNCIIIITKIFQSMLGSINNDKRFHKISC